MPATVRTHHPSAINLCSCCCALQEDLLAYDFNNQAVAESYALRETMKMLLDDDLAFLDAGSDNAQANRSGVSQRKVFRSHVIQMVLATDMSCHFDLLSKFETQILHNKELQNKPPQQLWRAMTNDQRMLVLKIAIKVRLCTRPSARCLGLACGCAVHPAVVGRRAIRLGSRHRAGG